MGEEEAAKGLILVDILRCPSNLIAARIGKMTGWFYNHLARLTYAEACHWRPMHISQLQDYANLNLRTHYVDGDYGEYIFPNKQLFARESTLYADVATSDDGNLHWNAPKDSYVVPGIGRIPSPAFDVLDALFAVGASKPEGATVLAEVWGAVDFRDQQGFEESKRLTKEMLQRLDKKNLVGPTLTDKDVRVLYGAWQFPMYNLDLRPIKVTREQLERERERLVPYDY